MIVVSGGGGAIEEFKAVHDRSIQFLHPYGRGLQGNRHSRNPPKHAAERLAIERVQLQPVPTPYGGRCVRSFEKPVSAPLYDKGGELALQEISRKKPILKNRTAPEIEQAVVAMAIEPPAWGQVRVSEALNRRAMSISTAGVRCVWQRHDLTSIKLRLKQYGFLLTESQIAALEKAEADKEAHGEFDSECPGYCGDQDAFYVGTLKGVGRVYQQTVIDTYAKVAFVNLYDPKTPITVA